MVVSSARANAEDVHYRRERRADCGAGVGEGQTRREEGNAWEGEEREAGEARAEGGWRRARALRGRNPSNQGPGRRSELRGKQDIALNDSDHRLLGFRGEYFRLTGRRLPLIWGRRGPHLQASFCMIIEVSRQLAELEPRGPKVVSTRTVLPGVLQEAPALLLPPPCQILPV